MAALHSRCGQSILQLWFLSFSLLHGIRAARQANFAAWYKELNYGTFAEGATLYSAGRASRWESAHILVVLFFAHIFKTSSS